MKEEAAHSSDLEDTISTVESLGAGYLKGRSRSNLRPVPRKSLPDPQHIIHFLRVRVILVSMGYKELAPIQCHKRRIDGSFRPEGHSRAESD